LTLVIESGGASIIKVDTRASTLESSTHDGGTDLLWSKWIGAEVSQRLALLERLARGGTDDLNRAEGIDYEFPWEEKPRVLH
jgi:hypothetical protein